MLHELVDGKASSAHTCDTIRGLNIPRRRNTRRGTLVRNSGEPQSSVDVHHVTGPTSGEPRPFVSRQAKIRSNSASESLIQKAPSGERREPRAAHRDCSRITARPRLACSLERGTAPIVIWARGTARSSTRHLRSRLHKRAKSPAAAGDGTPQLSGALPGTGCLSPTRFGK